LWPNVSKEYEYLLLGAVCSYVPEMPEMGGRRNLESADCI